MGGGTASATVRVDRLATESWWTGWTVTGEVTIGVQYGAGRGLTELCYYYSKGHVSERGKQQQLTTVPVPPLAAGAKLTVSLKAGELVFAHNGKKVHRYTLPEDCGRIQLQLFLDDAKVTLL